MEIMLPSMGLGSLALALMSDKVWVDDKLLHLSGLPVTDTGEDPLSSLCGTTDSECLSGL
jgi:hypothetical protein